MKTITVKATADSEGTLHVDVPTGISAGECEIVIRVNDPKTTGGWLPGFLDRFREGWKGAPLVREAQEGYPNVEPLQ